MEGFADPFPLVVPGSNLTSTKARLLLMACLMKFRALPVAADPLAPTPEDTERLAAATAPFQKVFDSH